MVAPAGKRAAPIAYRLKHNKEFSLDNLFKYRFIRIITSCLIMAGVLLAGRWALQFVPPVDGKLWQIVTLCLLVGMGGVSFFIALLTTKAFSVKQIIALLKRKGGKSHA